MLEIYPAYLQMLEGDSVQETQSEERQQGMLEYLYEESGLERPETGTDEELIMAAAAGTSTTPKEGGRRRSVRFSFDDCVIPSMDSLDELGFDTLSLKPVAEHHVTPVPSPVPYEMRDEPFGYINDDGDDDYDDDDGKTKSPRIGLVESLLLRLLDDVNNRRLTKSEIFTLRDFVGARGCFDDKEAIQSGDEELDSESVASSRVVGDLVEFTLAKILDDVKAGSLDEDDLTNLTVSIIGDTNNNSGLNDPTSEHDLHVGEQQELEVRPESTDQVGQAEKEEKEKGKQNPNVLPDDSVIKPLHNKIPSECCSSTTIPQIGAEVITQTIINIKEGRLSGYNMDLLAHDVSKDSSVKTKTSGLSLGCFLVDVLEEVKSDIGRGVVSSRSMENVTQQLSMLSVQNNDSFRERYGSILSLTEITDLIKCALSDVASDAKADDRDTRFHPDPVESDDKGCNCLSSSTEASVTFPSSSVVNDMSMQLAAHTESHQKREGQSVMKEEVGTIPDHKVPPDPSSLDTFSVISDSCSRRDDSTNASTTPGSVEASCLRTSSSPQTTETAEADTCSRTSGWSTKDQGCAQGQGDRSEGSSQLGCVDTSQEKSTYGSPNVRVTISSPQEEEKNYK
ncbi:uncharacterized protein LOC121380970 isoform X2 [Gigantopelta aegis]|uniref:uncharacterized protein LOC121380970 isoform X2 n=1 Tax=Gigantopelta aegis TaxID=1735272 RepID=UPI001B88C9F8|nr:uncharacterized protein LOC121380970 isoform X2 [Gigantopelta aegis]